MRKAQTAKDTKIEISEADLNLEFPEPTQPLLEGPGDPVTWQQFMQETAAQTNYWLKHFGPDLSPPPFDDRFCLD